MNKLYKVLFLGILFLVTSCGKEFTAEDLKALNGYWEIEKAQMPDGEQKDYSINESIDYFELTDQASGFRQKVLPQISGEYLTNEVQEKFTIVNESGKTWIKYKTEYSEWKEEVVDLDEDELVVKNESDIIYHYKRPVPFTLK